MWILNTNTCIRYIFVVCVIKPYDMLNLHRDFTGVRENLNAMKHSIELCLFTCIGAEKNLGIVFSFKKY